MGRTGRPVRALYSSLLCNSMGHTMLSVVLGLHVYDLTRRELDLGILGLAAWLPMACLVLVTGPVADRVERRYVVAAALVAGSAVSGGMAWYSTHGPDTVDAIFVMTALYGVTRAFVNPALNAIPADIVGEDEFPAVVARGEICHQVSFVLAPIIGGIAFVVDVGLAYVVVAVLLAGGAVSALRIRTRSCPASIAPVARPLGLAAGDSAAARRAGEAFEGLRLIRSNPVVAGAISLDLFAVLLGGALVLLPAIAEERLGVGPIGVGWLRAAVGIGAAVPTLWLAARPMRRNVGPHLLRMVAVFGAATVVLGLTTSFAVAFVAMLVLSGADAVSVYIRKTLVPLATPRDKRGRVIAFEQLFVGASNEVGGFRSGIAGQLLGPGGAVAIGGLATVGVVVAWASIFPALRRLDTFADGAAASINGATST